MLIRAGVPSYDFPEQAIASLEAMYDYTAWREGPPETELCYLRDRQRAGKVIEKARARGCVDVVEFQAQELLKAYNLPVPDTRLARTSDEAVEAAAEIGLPVVLKIASPQISHKSDVQGVAAGLESEDEVRRAFIDITSRASRLREDAVITGCLVQQMAPKGSKEIIIGFSRDSQFGPLIMFGLGGVYVEVLKDISFRLGPLSVDQARQMVREIRSFPLLRGVRGEPPVNFKAIEEILLIMSQMALDFPEIQEADFNPVLVNQDRALVADVRLTLCSGNGENE
jgi:acetyltransferase